jgi:hypothetical protein
MGSRFVIRPTTFIDRTISWCDSISDELTSSGPMVFTHDRLVRQQHLFAHRAALVYTPTENIPEAGIGIGSLDVTLPIVTPDFDVDGRAYVKPGFWVDLLQRHTGKLRWRPISRAHVTFVRYDCYAIRFDHMAFGVKALLDALKSRAQGRRDGKNLYYFGAIVDDGPGFIEQTWEQVVVEHPSQAKVRVHVGPYAETTDDKD